MSLASTFFLPRTQSTRVSTNIHKTCSNVPVPVDAPWPTQQTVSVGVSVSVPLSISLSCSEPVLDLQYVLGTWKGKDKVQRNCAEGWGKKEIKRNEWKERIGKRMAGHGQMEDEQKRNLMPKVIVEAMDDLRKRVNGKEDAKQMAILIEEHLGVESVKKMCEGLMMCCFKFENVEDVYRGLLYRRGLRGVD